MEEVKIMFFTKKKFEKIFYAPKEDITPYEVSLCLGILMDYHKYEDSYEYNKELIKVFNIWPENLKRHFYVRSV